MRKGFSNRLETAVAIERAVRAGCRSRICGRGWLCNLAFHDVLLEVVDDVRRLVEGLAVDEEAGHLALAADLDQVLAVSHGLVDVVEWQLDVVCLHEGEDLVAPGTAILDVKLEIRRHEIHLSFAVIGLLVP
jgi:hypothetical protein